MDWDTFVLGVLVGMVAWAAWLEFKLARRNKHYSRFHNEVFLPQIWNLLISARHHEAVHKAGLDKPYPGDVVSSRRDFLNQRIGNGMRLAQEFITEQRCYGRHDVAELSLEKLEQLTNTNEFDLYDREAYRGLLKQVREDS